MKSWKLWLVMGALSVPSLCLFAAVGPNYKRPATPGMEQYADAEQGTWKVAVPGDAIARGNWWAVFGDPTLDDLERQAAENNQDLKAAVARVAQAQALARNAKSEFFPNINGGAFWARSSFSGNSLNPPINQLGNDMAVPFDLTYELDVWGKVRRSFEGATMDAQATMAAFENAWLLLKADVGSGYYALRTLDSERVILRRTIVLRREALDLVQSRFKGGASSELDVSRADTELHDAEAELVAVERRRSEAQNALALLLGKPTAEFMLAEMPLATNALPPIIPAGLPSELLERRPDIAEAERRLAAANARIGVAKAAFFPVVRLTGIAGFESADVETLFTWQSRVWSLGPSITFPIFEGGRNRANLKKAWAVYEENVAVYRQQILVAFKETQDALTAARLLSQQAAAQNLSLASARKSAELSNTRYISGLVSYLDVVDSERTALSAERQSARLTGARMITSVQIVKALGGGWGETVLPKLASRK